MEALTALGLPVVIVLFFWAIAGFLLPFLVWGIYNQTSRSARELEKLRKLKELEIATLRKQNPSLQPKPIDSDPARNM